MFVELSLLSDARLNKYHGSVRWNGGYSALNAKPYVLAGEPSPNPSYSSNMYGASLIGRRLCPA